MTTQELLDMDMSKRKNKDIICKILHKVEPVQIQHSYEGEMSLKVLEKALLEMCAQYSYGVQTIYPYFEEKQFRFYTASVIKKTDTTIWCGNVYGKTMWEIFAKLIIKIYSEIKREKSK